MIDCVGRIMSATLNFQGGKFAIVVGLFDHSVFI